MYCGIVSEEVFFKRIFTLRRLISKRLVYAAASVKKLFLSSFCTSRIENLRFSVPRVLISTLSLSFTLYSTLNGLSSVVVAVTLIFLVPSLWLMTVAESGLSLIVRLNFLGFSLLAVGFLRLVFLLEKRSSTFFRYGILP